MKGVKIEVSKNSIISEFYELINGEWVFKTKDISPNKFGAINKKKEFYQKRGYEIIDK